MTGQPARPLFTPWLLEPGPYPSAPYPLEEAAGKQGLVPEGPSDPFEQLPSGRSFPHDLPARPWAFLPPQQPQPLTWHWVLAQGTGEGGNGEVGRGCTGLPWTPSGQQPFL